MFKVFDAQGNYILVHHLIDVKDHLNNGYKYFIEAGANEFLKEKSSDKMVNVIIQDQDYLESNGKNKFDVCRLYTTNKSKLIVRTSDFLTIIGTSSTVFNDIKKWGIHGDVSAVNDSAFYLKRFDHLVTVHGNLIPIIKTYRKLFRNYEKFDYVSHSSDPNDVGLIACDQHNADFLWKFRPIYRSSGLLAIWIGIALGYKSILVHGITMDHRNHFYDFEDSPVAQNFDRLFNLINNNRVKNLLCNSNVRVSSGKFSELIGKPTKRWLDGHKSK